MFSAFCTLTFDQEFFKNEKLRRNSLGNRVIFIFSRQKSLTQEYFKPYLMIAFCFTLFEGYKCNTMYEITPKERFLWDPRKQTSMITSFNSQNEISRVKLQKTSAKGHFSSLRKQLTFGDATTGFPGRQVTSEKRAQKLHTDDTSLPRSG